MLTATTSFICTMSRNDFLYFAFASLKIQARITKIATFLCHVSIIPRITQIEITLYQESKSCLEILYFLIKMALGFFYGNTGARIQALTSVTYREIGTSVLKARETTKEFEIDFYFKPEQVQLRAKNSSLDLNKL